MILPTVAMYGLKNIVEHGVSKRTDPEFPAGAPWTPQIPGPGHPEPKSIFTSPLSVGPKLKKNMIPSELRVPDFMKFSTAILLFSRGSIGLMSLP